MPAADRNLLLGILALQHNFISRDALLAAFSAWVADKSRDLGEILRDRGELATSRLQTLSALTDELINELGSATRCLEQFSSVTQARHDLERLQDTELLHSLSLIGPPAAANRQEAAIPGRPSVGGSRFRIVRPHAQGGLGVVSVAHDSELNRDVALKEIKASHAHDQESRARFLLEAEITGGLEHPGIVPVYSLGAYGDGRPFYAMRFIRGDSLQAAIQEFHAESPQLTESERNLRLRRLLQRFIDVCEAMQYAHSRGVLHRDLKPSNIMLGKYGETLVVDWGLARTGPAEPAAATKAIPDEASLRPRSDSSPTVMGQAVGTPQYMSPEQAAGRLDLLGPATDIYALGATLYAILTGRPPIAGGDIATILRSVEQGRIVPPRQVNSTIPRPLEAIVLKALALEPTSRYPTARELAEDLEQWLADEPVQAYREPLVARVRRGLRKRPGVTGSVLATLLVGLLACGVGYVVLGQKNWELSQANANLVVARQDALQQKTKAETEAKRANDSADRATKNAERAEAEKNRVRKAMDFLVAAFRKPDPAKDGRDLKAADLLLTAAQQAQVTLKDEPLLQATLLNAIWMTLEDLGVIAEARPVAEAAVRIRLKALGPDHADTLSSLSNLASSYAAAGEFDKAVTVGEVTLKKRQETLGPDHPDTLLSLNNLALAYRLAGQLDKALPLFKEALEKQQAKLGADHPDTLLTINNLATAYYSAGKLDQALPLLEGALQQLRTVRGADHPVTLSSLNNLAAAYVSAGQLEKALPLLEESLQKRQDKLGPDHPDTLTSMGNLAAAYYSAKQVEKALPLLAQALPKMRAKLGANHPDTLASINNLALIYESTGQIDKALPLYEETLEQTQAKLGADHPDTLSSLHNLAGAYKSTGQIDKALALHQEAVAKMQAKLGPDHPTTLVAMDELAGAHLDNREPARAIPLLRETLAIRELRQPDAWFVFSTRSKLGGAIAARGTELLPTDQLAGEKLLAEAEPLLIEGFAGLRARQNRIPPLARVQLTEAGQRLVDLYTAWDKPAEAEKWQAELAKLKP